MALGVGAVGAALAVFPAAPAVATEASSPAASQPTSGQYVSGSDSGEATVAGTSSLHDWSAQSATINGTATFAGDLVPAAPPAIQSIQLAIPVNSLKSGEGSSMDDNICDALKMKDDPQITFTLTHADLKSPPSASDPKFHYDAVGQLTIAGTARSVNLALDVQPGDGGTLTIAAKTPLKMTDFGVKPPTAMLGMIKSGDAVTVNVTWQLAKKAQ
jgi:polyisoprenoid-binding protein YceI